MQVRPAKIGGRQLRVWWFNPRNDGASELGLFEKSEEMEFRAPTSGRGQDWVLVLDDALCGHPPPGSGASPVNTVSRHPGGESKTEERNHER